MIAARAETLGPVRLLITDRRGGSSRSPWDSLNLADHVGDDPSAVAENRGRVAAALRVADVAVVHADHGRTVQRVERQGTADPGDILVTTRPGLGLLVLAADCVPAVLVAPGIGALAVVHSGWRGVSLDAAGAAVAALVDLGANPSGILARLGPSICPGCYEVSDQVRAEVAASAPPAAAQSAAGTAAVDLAAGVVWQLRRRGVENIAVDRRCTFESEDLFSYRRDGRTGRHGVLAVLGES